jgi:hypothetical protein
VTFSDEETRALYASLRPDDRDCDAVVHRTPFAALSYGARPREPPQRLRAVLLTRSHQDNERALPTTRNEMRSEFTALRQGESSGEGTLVRLTE